MKGYKGMNKDMTCRGMQYEIGKTYHEDGYIKLCRKGLHFCEKLKDAMKFYERDDSRYFEVEATGLIYSDGQKSVTSDLTIIRELSDIEINRALYGNGYGDGNIYVYRDSYVYRDGYGDGYGYGGGGGYGNGDGDAYGNGYGYGYGYGNSGAKGDIQELLEFID